MNSEYLDPSGFGTGPLEQVSRHCPLPGEMSCLAQVRAKVSSSLSVFLPLAFMVLCLELRL